MEVGVLVGVCVAVAAVAWTLLRNSKGVAKSRSGDGFGGEDTTVPDGDSVKPQ